jgi:hypothetical protein
MTEARDFLTSLAQALAARRLYGAGHPRARGSLSLVVERAEALLASGDPPRFTFLGPEVILGDAPLRGFTATGWTERLSEAGVQRVELRGVPTEEHVQAFLEHLEGLLQGPGGGSGSHRADASEGAEDRGEIPTIAWGAVRLRDEVETATRGEAGGRDAREGPGEGGPEVELGAELAATTWAWSRIEEGAPLPVAEVEGVVRSLRLQVRGLPEGTACRLSAGPPEGYAPRHALNTAVLALAWARDLALPVREAVDLGLGGLLHDVGLALTARGGVLDQKGPLDARGVAAVEAHPEAGGRLLLEVGPSYALPALVAFEHHLSPAGGGYPAAARMRRPHPAARLVQLFSTWDALRSPRPHREAFPSEDARARILQAAEEGTLDRALVERFLRFDPEIPARAGG